MPKVIIRLALVTTFILMTPLLAMQFTAEVNWTAFDFVFAGVLIFGTGFLFELARKKASHSSYKTAVGIALAAVFLLIWINSAVGIIGNEDNPANLMYFGVVTVGIIGAGIARFQPRGMARVLLTMAIAQMLVPVIALFIAKSQVTLEPPGVVGVFGLNSFFAMLFVVSALLFKHASAIDSKHIPT